MGDVESIILLVVLVVFVGPLALLLWLLARSSENRRQIDQLSWRLNAMEAELLRLKREQDAARAAAAEPAPPSAPVPIAAPIPREEQFAQPAPSTPVAPLVVSQPIEPPPAKPEPVVSAAHRYVEERPRHVPPPPPRATPEPEFAPPEESKPAINWEQFMGVKGFAWLGGFALFLGVAFFVKYSFDNNLVPPALRVTIGFLTGLGLMIGGVVMSRRNFPALSQTLCATGVVILYAVTFACRSVYHFEFFGTLTTFGLMVLITAAAFLLAVRLDALVVAILGMLGGFLTPVLLSTGQNNPLGLFGYLAILDAGLMLVALNRRWDFLAALAAGGTALMQLGWVSKFFEAGHYALGNKIFIPLATLAAFNVLWLAANAWAKRRGQFSAWFSGAALGLLGATLLLTGYFLTFATLAHRPWLIFGFVFLMDLIVLGIALLDQQMKLAPTFSGAGIFLLLGGWTVYYLSNDLLGAALAFYFIFAVLHSGLAVWLQRRGGYRAADWTGHLFPILALVLVLMPVFNFKEVSFAVWPFILLVDLLAIALAELTGLLLPILAVLALTFAATALLIFKIPADLSGLSLSFCLLGAFTVFFVGASLWLVEKLKSEPDAEEPENEALKAKALLPACSIVLPFLLAIMATTTLKLADPSPVFGLGLLLVVLLLGVARFFVLDWMPAIGLLCLTALECTWHFNYFSPANPAQPLNVILGWYLVFLAVFAVFPFVFFRAFAGRVIPWATAALAAAPQFFLIHRFVAAVHPNPFMGLLPAAFAIPELASLYLILKRVPPESPARMGQLAWFGGMALLFITLIVPIQFDREWITIGWALEGAALLWLFHRVPHDGLRVTGLGLLIVAFVRLAANPAVLAYHPHAAAPILNWYLYAYGMAIASLYIGAKLLAPPRHILQEVNVPPILGTLGTILSFLLLNIEIADYFSAPGTTLTFDFTGNFGRDMTYSIAWSLFALGLLVYGIWQKIRGARYAAMALLCVTLLKLFLHDLAQLGQLYRIGAFVGVAIVAMLASYAYQKFYAGMERRNEK